MRRFLDPFSAPLPGRVIVTDDPMRVKMLAAHYLDGAQLISERRGMLGYAGAYRDVPLALFSAGWGESSTLCHLQELVSAGAGQVVYLGECAAAGQSFALGDVILAQSARGAREARPCDPALMQSAIRFSRVLSIPARQLPVFTCDTLWLCAEDKLDQFGEVVDFSTNSLYWYLSGKKRFALSILTVSEQILSRRRIDDAARQSRFHSAARLAFEALAGTRKLEEPKGAIV